MRSKIIKLIVHKIEIMEDGFENVIPVLDSKFELDRFYAKTKCELTVGIRMAINEEPQSAYYTSRLGIRSAEIIDYYKTKIAKKIKNRPIMSWRTSGDKVVSAAPFLVRFLTAIIPPAPAYY